MATVAPLHPIPVTHTNSHANATPSNLSNSSKRSQPPRGSVEAVLNFYTPPADGAAPFNYVETPPEGQPQNNYGVESHTVPINDIRGREQDFNLDNNAFQVITTGPSAETAFTDDAHIKSVYYPEVEQLLLDHVPGVNRVFIFDHTIRRANSDPQANGAKPSANRGPVQRVHIDQTPKAGAERVRFHLPDEADTLLKSRYRIINVWRPINGPIYGSPLAVADGSTVSNDDVVGVQHRYPDRTGETAGVKHNNGQKWYYLSGMQDNERLLLKCCDSDDKVGKHGRVPHSAFLDPRTPEDAPPRESIEVRTLVFG